MPRILVTGATGTFGGEVTRQLQALGEPVRVLVRDAAKASKLNETVQVVVGDFARPESLDAALAGIERVFLASYDSPGRIRLKRSREDVTAVRCAMRPKYFCIACTTAIARPAKAPLGSQQK